MDESEMKLIHFDSTYFLPAPIPLTRFDQTSKNIVSNRVGTDHLLKLFREHTNRNELKSFINSAPNSCTVCNINLAGLSEVLSHIFSQPHMEKCVKMKGLIMSNSGFSFWIQLLKMFPKNRSQLSKERKIQELQLFSASLDLHSRASHSTVEVSSAQEKASALDRFISDCFAESLRVRMFVKDKKEANSMNKFVYENLPGATVIGGYQALNEQDDVYYLNIEGPDGHGWTDQAVIYLRPPVGSRKWPDPLTAYTAFILCSSSISRSLMLINGSEERTAFRAFENRFMQPRESGILTISHVTAPDQNNETAGVEAEEKSTEDGSVTFPPIVDQSISTVPREETTVPPVDTPPKTTVSNTISVDVTADNGRTFFVDHNTKSTTWDDPRLAIASREKRALAEGCEQAEKKSTVDGPTIVPPTVHQSTATVPREETTVPPIDALPKTTVSKLLVATNPLLATLSDILKQPRDSTTTREILRVLEETAIAQDKTLGELRKTQHYVYEQMAEAEAKYGELELKKHMQEQMKDADSKIGELERNVKGVWIIHQQLRVELGESEKTTVPAESTVSKKITIVNPETVPSTPNMEEWIGNFPTINESEVKEWPEIFSPFDEEEGKAVEELIERMTD